MAVNYQYEINGMRQDAIRRTREMQRRALINYNNRQGDMPPQESNVPANRTDTPLMRSPNPNASNNAGTEKISAANNTSNANASRGAEHNNQNRMGNNNNNAGGYPMPNFGPQAFSGRIANPFYVRNDYSNRNAYNSSNAAADNQSADAAAKNEGNHSNGESRAGQDAKNISEAESTAHSESENAEAAGTSTNKETSENKNFLGGFLNNLFPSMGNGGKLDSEKLLIIALIILLAKEGADLKLMIALGYILM